MAGQACNMIYFKLSEIRMQNKKLQEYLVICV